MKNLIIALLLLAATPAFASAEKPTAAQLRDISTAVEAYVSCDAGNDPVVVKACVRYQRLQRKLKAQGFCFYKRMYTGRPTPLTQEKWEQSGGRGPAPKDIKRCEPLHGSPPAR